MITAPERGFSTGEHQTRVKRAQALMENHGLDLLLVTSEPEVRYFTGFLTRFWESPTRPWYVLVPRHGDPVAVIPQIGEVLMKKTWVSDVRTWVSPNLNDDGETLLAQTIRELVPSGKIGVSAGAETHLRMPIDVYERLKIALAPSHTVPAVGLMRELRLIKSPAEIEKITHTCAIASKAFARIPEIAAVGVSFAALFSRFQMLLLEEGADQVSYMAGGFGPSGYDDVISPASEERLAAGDIFMLDTGAVWDGYFCDFDRNFALHSTTDEITSAHAKLIDATQAGLEAVRVGARACDLFHAMDKILTGGTSPFETGRLGHGLGMQLTEWPSLIPSDETILREGMVLTLEPGIKTSGPNMLVHEENIVITANGAKFLSTPAPHQIPIIGANA